MGRFSLLELFNAGTSCLGNRGWAWYLFWVGGGGEQGGEVPVAIGKTVASFYLAPPPCILLVNIPISRFAEWAHRPRLDNPH